MSLWIDLLLIRGSARRRKEEQARGRDDRSFLKGLNPLPADFRARMRRMDLATARRLDRLRLLGGLLGVLLVILALYTNAFWHAYRRARARGELREAPPPPPADEILTGIPWPYPYAADFDPLHPDRLPRLPEETPPAKFAPPPASGLRDPG